MSWHCIDCGAYRGELYTRAPEGDDRVCACPGPRGYGSSSVWRDPQNGLPGSLEWAEEAIERARGVVRHWREAANEADRLDAEATANLPSGEDRPIVTYVPASEGLRLAAKRLEDALDGW